MDLITLAPNAGEAFAESCEAAEVAHLLFRAGVDSSSSLWFQLIDLATQRASNFRDCADANQAPLSVRGAAVLGLRSVAGELMCEALETDTLDTAEAAYLRAKAILERVRDDESASYTAILNNLGLIYADKGDLARAEAHHRRALALTELLEGPDGYHISLYLQNLSNIARERKDYDTALAYATRALAIRQAYVGPDHVDMAPLVNNLAIVYHRQGKNARAEPLFREAVEASRRTFGLAHPNTQIPVGHLVGCYEDMASPLGPNRIAVSLPNSGSSGPAPIRATRTARSARTPPSACSCCRRAPIRRCSRWPSRPPTSRSPRAAPPTSSAATRRPPATPPSSIRGTRQGFRCSRCC